MVPVTGTTPVLRRTVVGHMHGEWFQVNRRANSALLSISRMSRPSTTQEPLSGSNAHGSGCVERWIDDQKGEDQGPRRLSPVPHRSDTIVHSRRLNISTRQWLRSPSTVLK